MPKTKRLTFRFDEELEKAITQMCETADCTKSELVEGLIRSAIDEADEEPRPGPAVEPRKEAYDVSNPKTGVIYRYNAKGELMFYFVPIEVKNGAQYYRDNLSDNPDNRWHKDQDGHWIPTVRITGFGQSS